MGAKTAAFHLCHHVGRACLRMKAQHRKAKLGDGEHKIFLMTSSDPFMLAHGSQLCPLHFLLHGTILSTFWVCQLELGFCHLQPAHPKWYNCQAFYPWKFLSTWFHCLPHLLFWYARAPATPVICTEWTVGGQQHFMWFSEIERSPTRAAR